MNIYFCGIGGAGLTPLAELCLDCGWSVAGSDTQESLNTAELTRRGIVFSLDQSGNFLSAQHNAAPVDWFVHSSAVGTGNAEYDTAVSLGLRITKRDELLNAILEQKNLKLIAVSGTHGKTTTTAMIVWMFQQLGVPVSYLIGSNISFGPAARYVSGSQYFVYECDEFDRNFLSFRPDIAVVPSLDYDHPDTYPTRQSYQDAFAQFFAQSKQVIGWKENLSMAVGGTHSVIALDVAQDISPDLVLLGIHNRKNMTLVLQVLGSVRVAFSPQWTGHANAFPGTQRRQEKLATDVYSDYAHHPAEILATIQAFGEQYDRVCVVYQPHQNIRQISICGDYAHCFEGAHAVYWLPTYLSREDPALQVLTPEQLMGCVKTEVALHAAQLDEALRTALVHERQTGSVLLFLGAGSIDAWARQQFDTMLAGRLE
jgi:UDP-N-acetylmuramate--alanine ligase